MAHDAAKRGLPLKDRAGYARSAEEIGRGHARGTAADDGGLFAGDGLGSSDGGHERVISVLRSKQLCVADVDGAFVEVAAAAVHAAVGTDGAGDERQGVFLCDQTQGLIIQALAAELQIFGDILLDGTAAPARRREAVEPGHRLFALAVGQRLDGLDVVRVCTAREAQGLDGLRVGAVKGTEGQLLHRFAHLGQAVVAAGLENGGGHSNGPDAGREELFTIKPVCAAGKGDLHLTAEFARDPGAHLNGQREQAAAGHIHFVVGQLAPGSFHGEGVGELETELQSPLVCQGLKAAEHRDRIAPLQILLEVVIVKDDIIIAHGVQDGARGLIAQDGGVALDVGVESLFAKQIRSDALDLIGRTAVERGEGHRAGDVGRDAVDKGGLVGEGLFQDLFAELELLGLGGVLHGLDIAVDLFAPDALKVIPDGHVDDKAVGVAKTEVFGQDLERTPGLDILVSGLGYGEFSGPLLVVAFIVRQDTRSGHAGCKIRAVHLLDGLNLKEARARQVGGDDILRKLGVGTRCGAKGRFDFFTENWKDLRRICAVELANAENRAIEGIFLFDPADELVKWDGVHSLRHTRLPPCVQTIEYGGHFLLGFHACRAARTRTGYAKPHRHREKTVFTKSGSQSPVPRMR